MGNLSGLTGSLAFGVLDHDRAVNRIAAALERIANALEAPAREAEAVADAVEAVNRELGAGEVLEPAPVVRVQTRPDEFWVPPPTQDPATGAEMDSVRAWAAARSKPAEPSVRAYWRVCPGCSREFKNEFEFVPEDHVPIRARCVGQ